MFGRLFSFCVVDLIDSTNGRAIFISVARSRAKVDLSKGESTHTRIVTHAMSLASTIGLEALTIGELATELGLSKSGLFAHFKSKEKLQLDVLDAAAQHFRASVFLPALKKPRGKPRLVAIFNNWTDWVRSKEFPGGCIFLAAASEWDDREGPVRDKLVDWFQALDQGLAQAVRLCINEKHFREDLDSEQFAYECHGIVMKYHLAHRLVQSTKAKTHAYNAFERLIHDAES